MPQASPRIPPTRRLAHSWLGIAAASLGILAACMMAIELHAYVSSGVFNMAAAGPAGTDTRAEFHLAVLLAFALSLCGLPLGIAASLKDRQVAFSIIAILLNSCVLLAHLAGFAISIYIR